MSERDFEHVGGELIYEGRIISVRRDRFRYPDGETVEREVITHPGAVAVLAVDDDVVHLVRQPREAVGDPDVLEIPAGRRDKDGEPPLECAKRELAEEIGKAADHWEHLKDMYAAVGVLGEVVTIYRATGLRDVPFEDSGENERIELVAWPLDDLDGAIAATRDSKTLVALLWLKAERAAARA
ncbi:NUDIX domain-containing protein [Paraconexibacter algicola]|uniref:NUDIX hydrolase n=1 Tax=Paraconexibacter algicola TaxID=2133960 RepID=A0A2T4UC56_9ACTN|nr:NUDIX hydrolase [Paraconexibacter algicola]PTL54787.1 NUDIX hydrolase [Paraconexibacter algicola]